MRRFYRTPLGSRPVTRRVLALLLALLVGVSAILLGWAPFADPQPARTDAIVVLAGSRSRLPLALRLWRQGIAPTLVVSRDPRERRRARFCADPPAHAICFSARPYSTRGEARTVARLARARGWDSLAVVTSRFHLFRTGILFGRCTGARLELVPAHVVWWRWPLAVPSELAKLAVAETTRRGC
jgi:uncharacterized SAM-binding protein YcdF (DUF218 family)